MMPVSTGRGHSIGFMTVPFLLSISVFSERHVHGSRSLYAIAGRLSSVCLSVVGNARAPYSADCNFLQYF